MLKKSLRLLPLIAALSTVSFPAQAAEYHVVVPAPGKAEPYAAIKLELNSATLPAGLVGDPFAGFDFNTGLRITGDPDLDMSLVAWSVYSGSLPAGLSLTREGSVYGAPTEKGELSFQALAKYKTKSALGTYSVVVNDITLALDAVLPQAHPKKAYHYSFAGQLSVDGDPNYTPDMVTWALIDGTLPSGLTLTASGEISGTPVEDGVYPITVQASYKGRTISKLLQLEVVWTEINILAAEGTRYWEDGTFAQSCKDYIQPSGQPYKYAGATGDGIYRIQPEGTAIFNVYCDMAKDGGGWTLLMKQAKHDAVTLHGKSTYWENGTVLNNRPENLSKNDGNMVSEAFSQMPAEEFMLQAGNEISVQKHSNQRPMTALEAFSDSQSIGYQDPAGIPSAGPLDWFIHASTYPYPGLPKIHQARFGFNIYEHTVLEYPCGVRWGWVANENTPLNDKPGSSDACGGLGAYGRLHALNIPRLSEHWQPATLYLWGK